MLTTSTMVFKRWRTDLGAPKRGYLRGVAPTVASDLAGRVRTQGDPGLWRAEGEQDHPIPDAQPCGCRVVLRKILR